MFGKYFFPRGNTTCTCSTRCRGSIAIQLHKTLNHRIVDDKYGMFGAIFVHLLYPAIAVSVSSLWQKVPHASYGYGFYF